MAENRLWRWEELGGYLRRLTLLKLPGERRLYLHHFFGDDRSRHPHDHPKTFVSIGLIGGYVEEMYRRVNGRLEREVVVWRAPWCRRFQATHIHRIRAKNCWTLVLTGKETRTWGFWVNHDFVPWRRYEEQTYPQARQEHQRR